MTRAPATAAVALLVALVLAGCGTDVTRPASAGTTHTAVPATATSSPTSTPTETPAAASTTSAAAPKTRVVVHDLGAQPRQSLRLAVNPGTLQHATMTLRMGLDMTVNGRKAPTMAVPAMRLGVDVSVSDVSSEGDITATFRYGDVKVLAQGDVADRIRAELAPVSQVHGTLRTTAFGVLIEGDFDVPAGLDPALQQTLTSLKEQLGNLVVPLPTVPVGVGATWTVHTESAVNGIAASADYDYRLLRRQGETITLEASYVQSIAEQQAHLPTLPPGVTARVHTSRITGAGRTVVDLGTPMPVESSLRARGPVLMTVTQGGQHADMVEQLQMDVSLQ